MYPRYGKLKRAAAERSMTVEGLIKDALDKGGNVQEAARLLEVNPAAVWRWMKCNNFRPITTQTTRLEKVEAQS